MVYGMFFMGLRICVPSTLYTKTKDLQKILKIKKKPFKNPET